MSCTSGVDLSRLPPALRVTFCIFTLVSVGPAAKAIIQRMYEGDSRLAGPIIEELVCVLACLQCRRMPTG